MQYQPYAHYGTTSLSRILEGITKPVFKKRGFAECRIITDWEKIVGKVIARYSLPQKLVFPPNAQEGGVLHIEVYDTAFATEIHYLGPLIREKIATYFGYPAVARLHIIQKPTEIIDEADQAYIPLQVASPVLDASVEDIKDPEIKEALKSLGQYVLA